MAFLLNPYHDANVPTKPILYEMERASYRSPQDDFKPDVPGWTDVFKSPTLHIFKPTTDGAKVFVVAIRGTSDFTDFKAWLPTIWNGLEGTNRWSKDYNDLTQFQEVYPPSEYTYYGVAHSLGGEILDQFIKKGMIKAGISYNPAIQTSDIPDEDLAKKNYRIYASGDPLYKLMGRWNHPSEVRPSPTSWYDMFKPFLLDAYSGYKQHILANPLFVGGEIPPPAISDEDMEEMRRARAENQRLLRQLLPTAREFMREPFAYRWLNTETIRPMNITLENYITQLDFFLQQPEDQQRADELDHLLSSINRELAPYYPEPDDVQGGAVPIDKALYEKAKSIVYPRYKKPSAYRSGALIKKYKELGGKFKEDGERNLERWFREDWSDVGNKSYPVLRPTRRINKDTPKTLQEIPKERLKEQIALKQKIKGKKNLPPF